MVEKVEEEKPSSSNVEEEESIPFKTKEEAGEFVFLMDINQREGEIVRSLLQAHGIEVRSRFNEAGGYLDIYMGWDRLWN